jgi:hypothetical protein
MTLRLTTLGIECCYAESRYTECRYTECRYTEYRYTERRYTECRYAECRGAFFLPLYCDIRWKCNDCTNIEWEGSHLIFRLLEKSWGSSITNCELW